MTTRTIKQRYAGVSSVDGAGVRLLRVFGHRDVYDVDPFLLLDFFDSRNPQDYIKGFPWHPHRGIETITYLISGLLEHGDSLGNKGVIKPMGCQWMTAGSGIIHQEMPQATEHLLGAQLWLNLPREHKMTAPTYRDIIEKDLAVYEDEMMEVKVIAGTFRGKTGPVSGTFVDPMYLDLSLRPGGTFEMEIDGDETVFLLFLEGSAVFADGQTAGAEDSRAALLTSGELVHFTSETGLRCLLAAGKPLHEPIAWGGPIVMNTRAELEQAFEDLDQGTFIR
ncbi:MAG: pirin family protein [Anaerolineaceae bacterium]|nr:pirin family protein [Anaerolineaceae bacterium]